LLVSRPYGIDDVRHLADLEVDNQGLNKEQVATYVKAHFKEQAAEQAQGLLQFLQAHPILGPLAQVPVNLHILCALWEEKPEALQKTLGGNLTGLYEAFTRYIWERYAEKYKGHKNPKAREQKSGSAVRYWASWP
jgi:hypothetical protein